MALFPVCQRLEFHSASRGAMIRPEESGPDGSSIDVSARVPCEGGSVGEVVGSSDAVAHRFPGLLEILIQYRQCDVRRLPLRHRPERRRLDEYKLAQSR